MLEFLQNRRSIRQYTDQEIPKDIVQELYEAAIRCPSSRSRKPWDFVFITDRESLQRLSSAKKHGSAFLAKAPMGICICARPEVSDVWIEDCSLAAWTLQITAERFGLGSCWIQIRERIDNQGNSAEDIVKGILNIPEPMRVSAILAIGFPAEKKAPHDATSLCWNNVHIQQYGNTLEIS